MVDKKTTFENQETSMDEINSSIISERPYFSAIDYIKSLQPPDKCNVIEFRKLKYYL
jgi:hypothetical protein